MFTLPDGAGDGCTHLLPVKTETPWAVSVQPLFTWTVPAPPVTTKLRLVQVWNSNRNLTNTVPYIGIFSRREILAKMTVKRRVIFSLSNIFAICWYLNGDFSLDLFFTECNFSDFEGGRELSENKIHAKITQYMLYCSSHSVNIDIFVWDLFSHFSQLWVDCLVVGWLWFKVTLSNISAIK